VYTPRWQQRVEHSARRAIDDATWSAFSTGDAARACKVLAAIARRLQRGQRQATEALTELLSGAIRSDTIIAKRVAGLIADKIVGAGAAAVHIPVIIRSVRVLGVYVCAAAGRDMTRCRCFQDLFKDETRAEAEKIIKDGLNEMAGAVEVRLRGSARRSSPATSLDSRGPTVQR
jgi:hypothetical protein